MDTPKDTPKDAPKRIGRYEILEELGRGAMGTVYRAKDPAMDRVVALKTIISVVLASQEADSFRERFFREARAAGALAHPGIVPVFDVGEDQGMPFLVMEFVTGKTLADATKRGERLSLERVCEIGQKIAEALGYAHQRGVVHRDIKPANILLTSREAYGIERPKITDFGVAKLAEGQTTLTGQMLGTPAFMPPEQFTGAPVDGRADIFSLGVVLYWMATGEQPFPGESMTSVSYKVVHTEPVPPGKLNPAVPAKLERVILKCLAKSPADRYQTGEELARDLEEVRNAGRGDRGALLQTAAPIGAGAGIDPDATFVESMPKARATAEPVAATRAPAPPAATTQTPVSTPAPPVSRTTRDGRLVYAALLFAGLAVVASGWYAMRSRQQSAVQNSAQAPTQNEVPPAAPVVALPAPAPPTASAAKEAAGGAPGEPAAVVAAKKAAAKAEAKPEPSVEAVTASKQPGHAATPAAAALGFDPRALDPKLNARLKIDADQMPAAPDFILEMNGKVYLRKSEAAGKISDDGFFVPPGVQEFRVTATSGAIQKSSNTVSAEFKAKKRSTLKIELRVQGAAPGQGVPQDLYPNTQIVLTLK